ncbi:MAG: hypothetical protein ACRCWB_11525 [Enterovibrio sp.]
MIRFPALITRRFTAHFKELSIRDAIEVAMVPPDLEEEAITRMLRGCVTSCTSASGDTLPFELWTAQERAMAVAFYISHTSEDQDFALGSGEARLSDYLHSDIEYPTGSVLIGDIDGQSWEAVQLTGRLLASLERIKTEFSDLSGAAFWVIGTMAAQLVPDGNNFDNLGDGDLDVALYTRMQVMLAFPERKIIQLGFALDNARDQLMHLFKMVINNDGIAWRSEVADTPDARFCANAAISEFARAIA